MDPRRAYHGSNVSQWTHNGVRQNPRNLIALMDGGVGMVGAPVACLQRGLSRLASLGLETVIRGFRSVGVFAIMAWT